MKSIFKIIFIIAFGSFDLLACSCSYSSKSFKDNLNFPYILEVEVLEHFEYKKEKDENYVLLEGYTKLLVNRSLKSKIMYDTMLFKNGQGSMCEINLGFINSGEKLLIKGWEAKNLQFWELSNGSSMIPSKQDSFFVNLTKNYKTIESTTCEYTYLKIENQEVTGDLTRNKFREKQRVYRILDKISNNLAERYKRKNMNESQLRQRMKLEEYWEILINKMEIRR